MFDSYTFFLISEGVPDNVWLFGPAVLGREKTLDTVIYFW